MKKTAFHSADILLPRNDFERWAVIACDQFTSEPEYWNSVENTVKDVPSTLRITLPEIYLDKGDTDDRIAAINSKMAQYLSDGVMQEYRNSMIYVERTQTDGKIRHGIVGAINLCDYDYSRGSKTLTRATEQTVIERIPPRVRIRKDAPVELPHAMLLFDDPKDTVISIVASQKAQMKLAYSFELMEGGGHIEGYFIPEELQAKVSEALDALVANDADKLLFAVGDGNHSLATAKECSTLGGGEKALEALVEIVNIHDSALEFEPIYRVLFNVDADKLLSDFLASVGGEYNGNDAQSFTVVMPGKPEKTIKVKPTAELPVGTLQTFLDKWLKENKTAAIDYIHGEDSLRSLCTKENSIGFIFEGMSKSQLFEAVRKDGSLPRKTFSMGHARDKRYYIEGRKIKD